MTEPSHPTTAGPQEAQNGAREPNLNFPFPEPPWPDRGWLVRGPVNPTDADAGQTAEQPQEWGPFATEAEAREFAREHNAWLPVCEIVAGGEQR